MNLFELAAGYLEAQDYRIVQRQRDLLHGRRPLPGQETHEYLVWVPQVGEPNAFRSQEGPYLSRFRAAAENYPSATKVMLVDTLEGLTPGFRSEVTKYRVTVRVPVEFFDTPFRAEDAASTGALSVADKLRTSAERAESKRVPQPYTVRGSETQRGGADLVDALFRNLTTERLAGKPQRPSVNLVVGPAGIGKSIFYEALFRRLYDTFLRHKSQRSLFPRPLPLVPDHIKTATARNLKSVIESALRTDFALPIQLPAFEWLLTNGLATWLLDGLDEIMARDPEFFDEIWEILTKPSGSVPPTIVICLRDSLLVTSDNLRDFCEELADGITIYELSPWETPAIRVYAEKFLQPRSETDRFIEVISVRPELKRLSSNPYYCSLLVDQFKAGVLKETYAENELLDMALSSLLQREYNKGLLDRTLLPEPKLREFLQALACEDFDTDFQGVDRQAVRVYAGILLPADLDQSAVQMLITHLVQIALFSEGLVAGNLRFAQDILREHLLGQYLYTIFVSDEEHFWEVLSRRIIPSDWLTFKTVARRIQAEGASGKLLRTLEVGGLRGNAFRNALQIAAYVIDTVGAIKRIPIEGHDLQGVKFKSLDLRGVSFRQCNLTGAEFPNCNLRDAKFEGAIIKNTAFVSDDPEALRGASFGDMEKVYSLITEQGKLETDQRAIGRWLLRRTGTQPPLVEACEAARQLRLLFGKFVYPTGVAKRAILPKRAALSGKAYLDPKETLGAALRHGYLVEEAERYRDRICRCEGDPYQELVNYVKDLTVSPGLRRLLNDLCPQERCPHVPQAK